MTIVITKKFRTRRLSDQARRNESPGPRPPAAASPLLAMKVSSSPSARKGSMASGKSSSRGTRTGLTSRGSISGRNPRKAPLRSGRRKSASPDSPRKRQEEEKNIKDLRGKRVLAAIAMQAAWRGFWARLWGCDPRADREQVQEARRYRAFVRGEAQALKPVLKQQQRQAEAAKAAEEYVKAAPLREQQAIARADAALQRAVATVVATAVSQVVPRLNIVSPTRTIKSTSSALPIDWQKSAVQSQHKSTMPKAATGRTTNIRHIYGVKVAPGRMAARPPGAVGGWGASPAEGHSGAGPDNFLERERKRVAAAAIGAAPTVLATAAASRSAAGPSAATPRPAAAPSALLERERKGVDAAAAPPPTAAPDNLLERERKRVAAAAVSAAAPTILATTMASVSTTRTRIKGPARADSSRAALSSNAPAPVEVPERIFAIHPDVPILQLRTKGSSQSQKPRSTPPAKLRPPPREPVTWLDRLAQPRIAAAHTAVASAAASVVARATAVVHVQVVAPPDPEPEVAVKPRREPLPAWQHVQSKRLSQQHDEWANEVSISSSLRDALGITEQEERIAEDRRQLLGRLETPLCNLLEQLPGCKELGLADYFAQAGVSSMQALSQFAGHSELAEAIGVANLSPDSNRIQGMDDALNKVILLARRSLSRAAIEQIDIPEDNARLAAVQKATEEAQTALTKARAAQEEDIATRTREHDVRVLRHALLHRMKRKAAKAFDFCMREFRKVQDSDDEDVQEDVHKQDEPKGGRNSSLEDKNKTSDKNKTGGDKDDKNGEEKGKDKFELVGVVDGDVFHHMVQQLGGHFHESSREDVDFVFAAFSADEDEPKQMYEASDFIGLLKQLFETEASMEEARKEEAMNKKKKKPPQKEVKPSAFLDVLKNYLVDSEVQVDAALTLRVQAAERHTVILEQQLQTVGSQPGPVRKMLFALADRWHDHMITELELGARLAADAQGPYGISAPSWRETFDWARWMLSTRFNDTEITGEQVKRYLKLAQMYVWKAIFPSFKKMPLGEWRLYWSRISRTFAYSFSEQGRRNLVELASTDARTAMIRDGGQMSTAREQAANSGAVNVVSSILSDSCKRARIPTVCTSPVQGGKSEMKRMGLSDYLVQEEPDLDSASGPESPPPAIDPPSPLAQRPKSATALGRWKRASAHVVAAEVSLKSLAAVAAVIKATTNQRPSPKASSRQPTSPKSSSRDASPSRTSSRKASPPKASNREASPPRTSSKRTSPPKASSRKASSTRATSPSEHSDAARSATKTPKMPKSPKAPPKSPKAIACLASEALSAAPLSDDVAMLKPEPTALPDADSAVSDPQLPAEEPPTPTPPEVVVASPNSTPPPTASSLSPTKASTKLGKPGKPSTQLPAEEPPTPTAPDSVVVTSPGSKPPPTASSLSPTKASTKLGKLSKADAGKAAGKVRPPTPEPEPKEDSDSDEEAGAGVIVINVVEPPEGHVYSAMSATLSWSHADLARAVCEVLVSDGRLNDKKPGARAEREQRLTQIFEAAKLDGAKLAKITVRGVEALVRKATQGESWVDSVIDAIKSWMGAGADKSRSSVKK